MEDIGQEVVRPLPCASRPPGNWSGHADPYAAELLVLDDVGAPSGPASLPRWTLQILVLLDLHLGTLRLFEESSQI